MKTAGTSIEVCLSQHCSGKDIVTPIIPENPQHTPRNFNNSIFRRKFYNHMSADEIRRQIGHEDFSTFFKFCFERHPVDKCISHFAMMRNAPPNQTNAPAKTWEEYLALGAFPNDSKRYTDKNGQLIVDKIYKYEELPQSLDDIFDKINVPHEQLSVFEKSGSRFGVPNFSDVMKNPDQKNRIMQAFEDTLRFVDYT